MTVIWHLNKVNKDTIVMMTLLMVNLVGIKSIETEEGEEEGEN